MAEVARWRSAFADMVGPRAFRRRAVPARDRLMRPLIGLVLSVYYLAQRLQGRTPQGWRTRNAIREIYRYQPLLPGEQMPHPGPSLRFRLGGKPHGTYPVRLVLFRDGVPYGMDEGIVTFEDGRLRYEGDATAFVLRPEDVALLPDAFIDDPTPSLYETAFRYGNLLARRAWAFDLAAHPDVCVYLYTFHTERDVGPSVMAPLFEWIMHPPEAQGATILPPLQIRPGYVPPKAKFNGARGWIAKS